MNTVLKKTKKSVCVVVSMVVMLLCFTAIPAGADSYSTISIGVSPVGFEILTPGTHTVTFYPASTSYTITFKTSECQQFIKLHHRYIYQECLHR